MSTKVKPKEVERKAASTLIPAGFAGTGPNGSFFEVPEWVDKSKPPGMTSQTEAMAPPGWWLPLVKGKFLFFSPNFVYFAIALAAYFAFPYDYQAARNLSNVEWILQR